MSSQPRLASGQSQQQGGGGKKSRKPLKALVIGSMSTGKSSILRQFVYHTFDPKTAQATIGCDFWHRNVTLPPLREGERPIDVNLMVWDTAGMQSFQSIAPSFFRGADGALLVYDITQMETFQHSRTWRDLFAQHAGADVPVLLVGNKLDLEKDERRVPKDSGAEFVAESSTAAMCGAVELSAMDSEAVERAFITLTRAMLQREERTAKQTSDVTPASEIKRVRLGSQPPASTDAPKKTCPC